LRLIDAGLLLNDLSGRLKNIEDYDVVLDVVNNMPTAYDVDNVIEQLEDRINVEYKRPENCDENGIGDGEEIYEDGRSQGKFEAYKKALEIVESAGIDKREGEPAWAD